MISQTLKREELVKLLYIYAFNEYIGHSNRNNHLISCNNSLNIDDNAIINGELDIVVKNLSIIDALILKNLNNYSIDRLNLVDLAIIRLATYEILYTDIPNNIIISEALNLTKKLSNLDDDTQRRFTNKLLDTIKNSII